MLRASLVRQDQLPTEIGIARRQGLHLVDVGSIGNRASAVPEMDGLFGTGLQQIPHHGAQWRHPCAAADEDLLPLAVANGEVPEGPAVLQLVTRLEAKDIGRSFAWRMVLATLLAVAEAHEQKQPPVRLVDGCRQRVGPAQQAAAGPLRRQMQAGPRWAVLVRRFDLVLAHLVGRHMDLDERTGPVVRAELVLGQQHDLPQERRQRTDTFDFGIVHGPEFGTTADFDVQVAVDLEIAGQTAAGFYPRRRKERAVSAGCVGSCSAHAHLAQTAGLATTAVGRQLQPLLGQRGEHGVAGVGTHAAQATAIRRMDHQRPGAAPPLRDEVGQAEAREQQPDTAQRQPESTDGRTDHERIVEVLASAVVHDVEHPEEVEQPPGLVAVLQHVALQGQVDGGVFCVREGDAPYLAVVSTSLQGLVDELR
mmetsp:Transcript_12856/g.30122  ORF Transcript_12856/g.30122 Transcript_12856/m.30122 type:complete len:422 (+) Transcript_12856:5648-6913(+)